VSDARAHGFANISLVIKERLPSVWRERYVTTISHQPNLVRFRHRSFEYICDVYSQLELAGSVPFDQTIADRVIGVLGTSSREAASRFLGGSARCTPFGRTEACLSLPVWAAQAKSS